MNKKRIHRLLYIMLLSFCFLAFARVNLQAKAIYTGNHKIDCAAEAIIRRASKKTMSREQKLKACYYYLVKNMRYSHSGGSVKINPTKAEKKLYQKNYKELKDSKKIRFSNKFRGDWYNLLTMRGTCKDMSGVMCIIANHLGFNAGYKTGRYVRSNGSSVEHWWNWIVVNGKRLYCDVQAANDGGHSIGRMNSYYLKSYGDRNWRRHHRG
ncbi:MAG: transglutaminase domain-containing protein [Eubacterium sp.]|nr:transglutaminase domain-containing protein [Eubacterium sp.]